MDTIIDVDVERTDICIMKYTKRSKEYQRWSERLQHRRNKRQAKGMLNDSPIETEKRKAKARADYRFFARTYFPEVARCECGDFQIEAARYILENKNTRAVFEWARGHAKSTHMGVMVPMWLMIQNERQFYTMVLVSKSEDSAVGLLADLQQQLMENELYIHDFGTQIKNGSWAESEFVTADDYCFKALGRGQSPRGLKNNSRRPDYILVDDIDDDEMCRNPKRVKEAANWVLSALFGTMEAGRGRFILVGNRISKTSILTELVQRPGVHHTVVNILDADGFPTWKENYKPEEVEEMRVLMGERNFQKEYMNNPVTEGAIFKDEDIVYGKMLPLNQYKEIVCYTDPSFKSSTKNDFKATMLVGITSDGHYHLIKPYCRQTTVSNMIGWHYMIMDYCDGTTVRYWMEANFIQDLLMDEFDKVGAAVGYRVPLMGDTRAKGDKFARIENMQPLFSRGLIIFNENEKGSPDMQALVDQLLMFEKGSKAHDDGPDALESAVWMLTRDQRKKVAPWRTIERTCRKY